MTELYMLAALSAVSLVTALGLWRWLASRDAGPAATRRVGTALSRAAFGLVGASARSTAVQVTAAAVALGAAAMVLGPRGAAAFGAFEIVVWSTLGLAAGALATYLLALAATTVTASASQRVLAAAAVGEDRALAVALRATGAVTLMSEATAILTVAGLFGLLLATRGALGAADATVVAVAAAPLLLPLALGVALAATTIQRTGGGFHAGADIAADVGGERDAGLNHDDTRNPALIADLVGDHGGAGLGLVLEHFAVAVVGNVLLVLLVASIAARFQVTELGGLLLAPMALRGLAPLSVIPGLLASRARAGERSALALARGRIVGLSISSAAAVGLLRWALGPSGWAVGAAVVLVLAFIELAATSHQVLGERRLGLPRAGLDATRAGDAPAIGTGMANAGVVGTVSLGLTAAGFLLGTGVAQRSGLPLASLLTLSASLAALLASLPATIARALLHTVVDGSHGIGRVRESDARVLDQLEPLGRTACAARDAAGPVLGAASGLIAAGAVGWLGFGVHAPPTTAVPAPSTALAQLVVPLLAAALAGAVVVTLLTGAAGRAAERTGRELVGEVERQLRGFPRDGGAAAVDHDFTPSYRACIDLATARARSDTGLITVLAIFVPVALGIALRVLYPLEALGGMSSALAQAGLQTIVVAAAVTGIVAASALGAARAVLVVARRASGPRGAHPGFRAAVTADAVGDVLGISMGPAARLAVKLTVVVALLLGPLL